MVKNITFCADETLIRKARRKAAAEHSSLNAKFRQWLEDYAGINAAAYEYKALMEQLSYARPTGKYTRDEMNER